MSAQSEHQKNREEYARLRREGALLLGEWVIVAEGRLHLSTPRRSEALEYLATNEITDAYFVQVGDEEHVYHID